MINIIKTIKRLWRTCIACLLLLAFILSLPFSALSQETGRQYKVEAAFLFNFFNYFTWPGYDSPEALVNPTLCVDREDPVEPYLRYIQQHTKGARNLTIRKMKDGESPSRCNLLFTRQPLHNKWDIPDETLIVLESDEDLEREGMIKLEQQEDHMVMVIHNTWMKDKGFKVSSRLLDLAEVR